MNEKQAYEILLKVVNNHHAAIVSSSEKLLKAMGEENLGHKRTLAADLLSKTYAILPFLHEDDVPDWSTKVVEYVTEFTAGRIAAGDFLVKFIPLKTDIENQKWDFKNVGGNYFNFEAIFENYRKSSRLPQLFDEIIKTLEQIRDSGEIDSKAMLNSLTKIIATLKNSKGDSYLSLRGAWIFLTAFLQNYLWGEFAKLPGLGTAVEALRETIKQMDEEMATLHVQIKSELESTLADEIKVASGKSVFGFLSYDKNGNLLSPEERQRLKDVAA